MPVQNQDGDALQGVKEITRALGLDAKHRQVVRSWVRRYGLPAVFLGGRWYARRDSLIEWWRRLEGRLVNAGEPPRRAP